MCICEKEFALSYFKLTCEYLQSFSIDLFCVAATFFTSSPRWEASLKKSKSIMFHNYIENIIDQT